MTDAREDYEPYYYLWHLIAIGVLKASPKHCPGSDGPKECENGDDREPKESKIKEGIASDNCVLCPKIEKTIWSHKELKGNKQARIALIDMGIAKCHPNLESQSGKYSQVLWAEGIDLASHRYGAVYAATGEGSAAGARHLEQRCRHLEELRFPFNGASPTEREILEDLTKGEGVIRYVAAYDQRYATHGTACAGLVCGTADNDDCFGSLGDIAAYYGVDPYSKIVPIVTSISPDPVQLIAAFLYAFYRDVDVILFPRDVANPQKLPSFDKLDAEEKTRLETDKVTGDAWKLLERVILEVSKKIPVVCAAGNDGRDELLYPASLAKETDHQSPKNGVIAVGAVSYAGYRSGYSNYSTQKDLTVVAPSDDSEVYNRYQVRIDKKSPEFAEFWLEGVHCPEIAEIEYSAERLVTLDVPGPRGYAGGSRRRPIGNRAEAVDDPGSLYTGFGGTSGAAAIVAGVVALMQRHNGSKLSGREVKKRLTAAPPNLDIAHWYWLDRARHHLKGDSMNGEEFPDEIALFGWGGLVDVPKLLGIDWDK